MTKYAAGQITFAVALAAVGAVKAARLLLDEIDDALSNVAGLK